MVLPPVRESEGRREGGLVDKGKEGHRERKVHLSWLFFTHYRDNRNRGREGGREGFTYRRASPRATPTPWRW
jgi:hypothetical protein